MFSHSWDILVICDLLFSIVHLSCLAFCSLSRLPHSSSLHVISCSSLEFLSVSAKLDLHIFYLPDLFSPSVSKCFHLLLPCSVPANICLRHKENRLDRNWLALATLASGNARLDTNIMQLSETHLQSYVQQVEIQISQKKKMLITTKKREKSFQIWHPTLTQKSWGWSVSLLLLIKEWLSTSNISHQTDSISSNGKG